MSNMKIDCNGINLSLLQPGQYQLLINRLPTIPFFCQNIQMPNVNYGFATQATPFHDLALTGDKLTFGDLVVSVLVDENLSTYSEIYNWIKNLSNLDNILDDVSDAHIQVGPKTFHFKDLFPVDISGFNLASNLSDVPAITFTASFKYTLFDLK